MNRPWAAGLPLFREAAAAEATSVAEAVLQRVVADGNVPPAAVIEGVVVILRQPQPGLRPAVDEASTVGADPNTVRVASRYPYRLNVGAVIPPQKVGSVSMGGTVRLTLIMIYFAGNHK
jgi:hypothetical protein